MKIYVKRGMWQTVAIFITCVLLLYLWLTGLLKHKAEHSLDDESKEDVLLPSKSKMDAMSYEELATLYHSYITSFQVLCRRVVRMGKLDDGGWEVCHDRKYRPQHPCLVYSFGVNNDFSFEEAVAKDYGCEVHSFDPSMNQTQHQHSRNVLFHPEALGGFDKDLSNGWRVKTLGRIMKDLGHSDQQLDILKIDVEDWEWLALPEMIETGSLLKVRQLIMEFHAQRLKIEPFQQRYFLSLVLLKDLYDAGFRIFYTHRNLWCIFQSKFGNVHRTGCHEVSLVQTLR